ncbi:hypothetical protein D6D13_02584 [Aureobasidium pullulans]|uniref:Uncharacterized protein n=1 Tax=Aureobasidium pullulans TaxID=5580 RepID=A0A4S9D4U6_AURPU|nr:hypothetical protein D6D13_02584 [Aureobasidium pullulans]
MLLNIGKAVLSQLREREKSRSLLDKHSRTVKMCWTKRKVWYQCRHETVDRGVCDKARRTGSACPADKWSYERLEYFGGTNIPCEHADCVKWNRRLAEMRQEALERNLTDATRHRMG